MPVLLYNVTMYTGVNLLPDAVEKLSEHPNIVGLKDSGNDMLQIADYLARSKPGFTVLAGAAPTLFTAAALGAHGAVLALAGIVPGVVRRAVRARAGRPRRRGPRAAAPAACRRAIDRAGVWRARPESRAGSVGLAGGVPRPPLRPAAAGRRRGAAARSSPTLGVLERAHAASR